MTLRDLLKKKDKIKEGENSEHHVVAALPEFTIVRSDTHTQEIIKPPSFASDTAPILTRDKQNTSKRPSRFRSSSSVSKESKGERSFSQFLHRHSHSQDARVSSVNVPVDLPNINDARTGREDMEAQWEERATRLAKENPNLRSSPQLEEMPLTSTETIRAQRLDSQEPIGQTGGHVSKSQSDGDIQVAIRLHESGDLSQSTTMFGRLANPRGENNALSQVLYGLALRHGWGVTPDASLAITYLSYAASNSASIESQALAAGMKKGGAAKGELVLAIYELGNCFRHGWGVQKDAIAARSYYETAANLGDTDAMNEAARCYEEGFGGKRDRYTAAKYYRLAEENGSKTLGNSWIWKEKYNIVKGK